MNRQAALMLGGEVGEVMAIDWRDREGGWGEYIRVRVWLDITKPLRRVVKMGTQTVPLKVALVKYERLPNFCYGCGLIGHPVEACKTVKLTEGMEEADLQFGEYHCQKDRGKDQVRQVNGLVMEALRWLREQRGMVQRPPRVLLIGQG